MTSRFPRREAQAYGQYLPASVMLEEQAALARRAEDDGVLFELRGQLQRQFAADPENEQARFAVVAAFVGGLRRGRRETQRLHSIDQTLMAAGVFGGVQGTRARVESRDDGPLARGEFRSGPSGRIRWMVRCGSESELYRPRAEREAVDGACVGLFEVAHTQAYGVVSRED